MASIIVQGYRVKVSGWDATIVYWLSLWNSYTGEIRKMPKNFNSLSTSLGFVITFSLSGAIAFCISWYLSQWPFIWPEATAAMALSTSMFIGMYPYKDCLRAILALIICPILLLKQVTFGVTAFGYHLEKYIYYTIIAAALITLWRYLLNWLCWSQIDRMCKKYGFPEYDQRVLEANYNGYEIPTKEENTVHETFSDAVASHKQLKSA